MEIEYIPDVGFQIGSNHIRWGEERASVRKKMMDSHKEDDRVIQVAEFFDGDESQNIVQKRDVYKNYHSKDNYFFLNYDINGHLNEVEIHWGVDILVKGIRFEFEKEISGLIAELTKSNYSNTEVEEGNFLFPELKMTIATSDAMGGDGTGLS